MCVCGGGGGRGGGVVRVRACNPSLFLLYFTRVYIFYFTCMHAIILMVKKKKKKSHTAHFVFLRYDTKFLLLSNPGLLCHVLGVRMTNC